MDIKEIHRRVNKGFYLIKRDAILHAVKEAFARQDIVDAIMSGQVIEEYPDRNRVLICGKTALSPQVTIYLHVLCEYGDPVYIEIITAYIPDERIWESPPLYRRKRR